MPEDVSHAAFVLLLNPCREGWFVRAEALVGGGPHGLGRAGKAFAADDYASYSELSDAVAGWLRELGVTEANVALGSWEGEYGAGKPLKTFIGGSVCVFNPAAGEIADLCDAVRRIMAFGDAGGAAAAG